MEREGVKGGGRWRGYLLSILFSFIIKFSFDLNRRKREMGRGMVRGGVEGSPPALGLIEER